jgi:hypothetical protein
MLIKSVLSVLLTLLLAGSAWAQSAGAQTWSQLLPVVLNNVQMKSQMTQQFYAFAQQTGNQQQMQLCQMESQLHQAMYSGLTNLMQNPQRLNDPSVVQQLEAAINEYNYRTEARDMRPYEQIQGEIARYVAHATWKATTAQGQAHHQSTINGIQGNTAQMTANHQQRMSNMQSQSNAHNAAWNQNQAVLDNRHQTFVHGINNEYQYVNPNTNQGYWVPMENTNPAVVNPDGTYTDLVPYHNY